MCDFVVHSGPNILTSEIWDTHPSTVQIIISKMLAFYFNTIFGLHKIDNQNQLYDFKSKYFLHEPYKEVLYQSTRSSNPYF